MLSHFFFESRLNTKLFWVGGFGDKIFVLPSEGVVTYVERGKTEIENDTGSFSV